MSDSHKGYPINVCIACGTSAAGDSGTTCKIVFGTWPETCDVCGLDKQCAAPRDFGYPKFVTNTHPLNGNAPN